MPFPQTPCSRTISLVVALAFSTSGSARGDEQPAQRPPTWKECWSCRDIEQEQCPKGKAGSACRKKHRRCDTIEAECFELEQSIFGPEGGEEPADPAPADDAAAGDDADAAVPPDPELVPPPRMPAAPAGEAPLPDAVLPETVPAPEQQPVPSFPSASVVRMPPLVEPAVQETSSRWTSGIAVASYCGIGVGAALAGVGAWQGLEAVAASRDFATAATQPEVFAARDRGVRAVTLANTFLISGAALAGASVVVAAISAAGVFDADDPVLSLAPAPGGATVAWTVALP